MTYKYLNKGGLKTGFNVITQTVEIKETLDAIASTICVAGKEEEYNLHRANLCRHALSAYCNQNVQFDLDGLKAASEFIHYSSAIHRWFEMEGAIYSLASFYGHIVKLHFAGEWLPSLEVEHLPLHHQLSIPELLTLEPIRSVEVAYEWNEESSLINQFTALNNLFIAQVGIAPLSENRIC